MERAPRRLNANTVAKTPYALRKHLTTGTALALAAITKPGPDGRNDVRKRRERAPAPAWLRRPLYVGTEGTLPRRRTIRRSPQK